MRIIERITADKDRAIERLSANNKLEIERISANNKLELDRVSANNKLELDRVSANNKLELDRISANNKLELERISGNNKLEIQSLTGQRDQVIGERAGLKQKCKELKADISHLQATVHNYEQSVLYWRTRYDDTKSVLSARGNAVSRATAWTNEEVDHVQGIDWSNHRALTGTKGKEVQKAVDTLLQRTKNMTTEVELYPHLVQCLNSLSLFTNRVKFVDTSQMRYLAGKAPDISVCIPRVTKPHAALVHGFIEVKKRGEKVDTAENLGQLKEYMLNTVGAQYDKGRQNYWGFLTNMETIILVEVTFYGDLQDTKHRVTQYPPMQWQEMVRYIHNTCKNPGWIPPTLYFNKCLGPLTDLIACNRKWQLGEFDLPLSESELPPLGKKKKELMVVKVSVGNHPEPSHRHELNVLQYLGNFGDQPASIIRLVWEPKHRPERVEFGISPRGKRFSLSSFITGSNVGTALKEIIGGIHWLHTTARVIHRDIRRDNIILHNGSPVIIDFDCSYIIPGDDRASTTYSGGLICVPNRVINKAKAVIDNGGGGEVQTITYVPEVEDDLFAFVMLVIALLFPIQFDRFPVKRMSWPRMGRHQLDEMGTFHEQCQNSEVWGKWWGYAAKKDYERLKGIGTISLFPSARVGGRSKY